MHVLGCRPLPEICEFEELMGQADYSFDAGEWKHVSKEAQRFVMDLLTPDPKKRPTAKDLLEHHWLVVHMPTSARALG